MGMVMICYYSQVIHLFLPVTVLLNADRFSKFSTLTNTYEIPFGPSYSSKRKTLSISNEQNSPNIMISTPSRMVSKLMSRFSILLLLH